MLSRQQVANQLREAAKEIQNLTNEKAVLASENAGLLQKIASLEAEVQKDTSGEENHDTALQKEAGFGFSSREGNSFGSSAEDLPSMGSDLTAEQRLDMILNGESPSDFQ